MYYPTAGAPPPFSPLETCSVGHSAAVAIPTSEGGKICLVCLSNLISNPQSPTIHVSYALSQLSQALTQPHFLHSFLTFHSHFLISPLVQSLSAFSDADLATQIIELISQICESARDGAVCGDFIAKLSDHLSSHLISWNRQQVHNLHCLGILLDYAKADATVHVKDKYALVSNLITGLQVPSEEIQGESLFVLYRITLLQDIDAENNFVDILHANSVKLFQLSLDVLLKTQDDVIRLNCIALLTVFAHRGWFQTICVNEAMDYCEPDNIMQTTDQAIDGSHQITLFAEAIKGPLLSSDSQVQVSTLNLISLGFSSEGDSEGKIRVLVEENIADYTFEILRLSGCKDPVVSSCIQALDLLSTAEEAFGHRLAVGFSTLVPVLRYVAEIPFHAAQTQLLKLVGDCVSRCPGIVSSSHVEEINLIVTGLLKKHIEGESGIVPEAFNLACSLLVSLMGSSSSSGALNLGLLQEASRGAVLTSLNSYDKHPDQFLYALYLLKETFAYSHEGNLNNPSNMDSKNGVMDVCREHILPWFMMTISNIEEEIILGVIETFHSILMLDSAETKIFANSLVSASWFSTLVGCLGVFPSENLKLRVYLIFSSIADVLLGNEGGHPISDAASYLPSDPMDLLFLLGQKGSYDLQLFSSQSAVLLILYISSLYDDWIADDKVVLASLEQYILVNGTDLLHGASFSVSLELLVNVYGLYRGLAKMGYQVPYSQEAEKIIFQLLDEKDWNLFSLDIHFTSLKWLFQQDKICKSLSDQMLRLCQCNSSGESSIVVHGKDSRGLDLNLIAELIVEADNFAAMILVFLLGDVVDKDDQEDDIISVVGTVLDIIKLLPAASDQLCIHGVAGPIWTIYNHPRYSSIPDLFMSTIILILTILRSVKSESLYNDDAWVAIVNKLIDCLINTIKSECWTKESPIVVGILALVLHHSTNQALTDASKIILLSTPLASAVNETIFEACSKGPALIDHDDGTKTGQAFLCLLLMMFFSLRSVQAVLPGITKWHTFLEEVREKQSAGYTTLRCHDFCKLLHFGPPPVKLVTSYCLLEILQRNAAPESMMSDRPYVRRGYLSSIEAILEGLIFSCDVSVSVNSSLCLSLLIEWDNQNSDESAAAKNLWCRVIVEELIMSLTVPRLASRPFTIYHKPAINVAVALLKSKRTPEWMATVFDEASITAIVENVSTSDLSVDMVLLFCELLKSGYLKAEHVASLNRVFQARRQHLYADEIKIDYTSEKEKTNESPGDFKSIYAFLVNLVSSHVHHDTGLGGSQNTNKGLLSKIDSFSKCIMEEEGM